MLLLVVKVVVMQKAKRDSKYVRTIGIINLLLKQKDQVNENRFRCQKSISKYNRFRQL